LKVLIQRSSTGLFLKGENEWVHTKAEAKAFSSSTSAMEFCMRRHIEDIGLLLSFDSGAEVLLDVFERDELKKAVARALELQEESRALMMLLDRVLAESKERRKQYSFKPPQVRNRSDEQE
jgi:hypothetical protein